MAIFSVFIISRSGSLIFHQDRSIPKIPPLERTLSSPAHFVLKDGRVEMELGAPSGHIVIEIDGEPLERDQIAKGGVPAMEYLSDAANYPLSLKLARKGLSVNEKIYLASTFFSVSAIVGQLSPAAGHSGIRSLHADSFTLNCYQSPTGIKFLALTDPRQPLSSVETLLRKMYELYADFALKNPFYTLDMPIRCSLFDSNLDLALDVAEKASDIVAAEIKMAEVKAENEHGGEQRNERARSRSPIRDERKGGSGGNKRGPPGSGRSGGGGGGRGAGDPHPRRVFVSNIPYDVKWQDLKDAFKKHVGDVSYVEIYEDEKGRSRGMGVIEFRDSGMVEKAIDVMNRHEIKDRKLVVKYDFETLDRGERRGGAPGASPGGMRGAPMGRDHREDRGPPPGRRPPGSSRWGDEVPPPPMRGAPVHPVDPSEKFGNTFGLSISFLESLGIDCPLTKRVFVVNV
ncbi:unnamed protein product, partial [Cyprideis torosa]